jgi:hypothetical protein
MFWMASVEPLLIFIFLEGNQNGESHYVETGVGDHAKRETLGAPA